MRLLSIIAVCILALGSCNHLSNTNNNKPKLVIGIVIDQMRYDYLYRFYDQYGENGFKRLMNQGMNFTYAQYNYVPTYTATGHASIYTGTTPYYHGIISNDWYDRFQKKELYCVSDTNYSAVGANDASGRMSPKNLKTSTIGDQLQMSNNGLSRVFSVSIKDRAAILPGGHMANAAYWYDGAIGNFVTSTYYMKELPQWVNKFNEKQIPAKLMSSDWTLSLAQGEYETVMPDDGPGEQDVFDEGKATFPHVFGKHSMSEKLDLIKNTPFGNELLTAFVIDLIKQEKTGQGKYTDFLAISYSSTDYIGHAYGPNSMEIMDTYIKLDKQLSRIIDELDKNLGKGNYLLFLTADHAVKPNSAYLKANHGPTGFIDINSMERTLNAFCQKQYGVSGLIEKIHDGNIYLNHYIINKQQIEINSVCLNLVTHMLDMFPEIATITTKEKLRGKYPERSMSNFILNGFNPVLSGDIIFELTANYGSEDNSTGTTHSSSYDYDTHVPLLFYGWHICEGESNQEVYVEDIVPTIASLLHIQEPEGTLGVPIIKPFKKY